MEETIEIRPLDPLFFRDGRPFTMGQDTVANGIFPPFPSTIYGALRTAYLADNPQAYQDLTNGNDVTENLQITAFYLREGVGTILPTPFDLVYKKVHNENKEDDKTLKLEHIVNQKFPLETMNVMSDRSNFENDFSGSINQQLGHENFVEQLDRSYIRRNAFNRYLSGRSNIKATKLSDLISQEPKIGIGRNNNTHVTEEGNLYRINMQDLGRLRFLVTFKGLSLPEKGIIRLGGEGKLATFRKADPEKDISRKDFSFSESANVKLILLTPSVFENGWIPPIINESSDIELVTAAVGTPDWVGGFDMKKGKPKTMRKVVNAGAVYYIKVKTKEALDKLIEKEKVGDSLCNDLKDFTYSKQGFGLFKMTSF